MDFAPQEENLVQSASRPFLRTAASHVLSIGTIIDEKYEIVDVLGQGGMGIVYQVKHRLLGKTFALKMLRSDVLSGSTDYSRFEQEAKALGRLHHPNIVAVTDSGFADGAPYLVMEYVDGKTLSQLIKENKQLAIPLFCDVFSQVAKGLAHAHASGIIHRDLKPSNIVVEPEGRVTILDFGIAKMTQAQNADAVTMTGTLIGSPSYMSPEQAQGYKVTAASDLYSLGCTMYEALVGTPPFTGENPLQTVIKHMQAEPLLVSAASQRLDIPQTVDHLIRLLLAKTPEGRVADASSIEAILSDVAAGRQAPVTVARNAKRLLGGRALAMTVAASLALIAGAVTFSFYFQHPVKPVKDPISVTPSQSTASKVSTMGGATASEADVAQITDALNQIAAAQSKGQWYQVVQLCRRYQPIAEGKLGIHSHESMAILWAWGEALRFQGFYPEGAELLGRYTQLVKDSHSGAESLAMGYLCQGICESGCGRYAKADELFAAALAIRKHQLNTPREAEAVFWMGRNAQEAKNPRKAIADYATAKTLYGKAAYWKELAIASALSAQTKQESGDAIGALADVRTDYNRAAASKNEPLRLALEPVLQQAKFATEHH